MIYHFSHIIQSQLPSTPSLFSRLYDPNFTISAFAHSIHIHLNFNFNYSFKSTLNSPRIQPKNVALSLQAIEAMAMRYGGRKNLVGFELLNEPAEFYGGSGHLH